MLTLFSAALAKRARIGARGQAMVEYALIISLIVIVVLVMLILLGNQVKNTYCNIEDAVRLAH